MRFFALPMLCNPLTAVMIGRKMEDCGSEFWPFFPSFMMMWSYHLESQDKAHLGD